MADLVANHYITEIVNGPHYKMSRLMQRLKSGSAWIRRDHSGVNQQLKLL